jgi:hypothetical protein
MTPVLVGITILLAAAYCVTAVLRRGSAALRHVVWTCAIGGTLLFAPLRWRAPQRVITQPLPLVFTPTVSVGAARTNDGLTLTEIALYVWAFGSVLVALRPSRVRCSSGAWFVRQPLWEARGRSRSFRAG